MTMAAVDGLAWIRKPNNHLNGTRLAGFAAAVGTMVGTGTVGCAVAAGAAGAAVAAAAGLAAAALVGAGAGGALVGVVGAADVQDAATSATAAASAGKSARTGFVEKAISQVLPMDVRCDSCQNSTRRSTVLATSVARTPIVVS